MARYSKALAALLAGVAGAAALLPTDAPVWLLGLTVAVQAAAVWIVPNRPASGVTTRRSRPSYDR